MKDYKEEFNKRVEDELKREEVESSLTNEELFNYALLLTQYERYGALSKEDVHTLICKEFFDDDEVSIWAWNDYCEDSKWYDDVVDYLDEDFFNNYYYNNPYKAVEATYKNSDFDLGDKFVKITPYGLESFNDLSDLICDEFKEWCIDNERCLSSEAKEILENEEAIVIAGNILVQMGF